MKPSTLTYYERLNLINQFEILAKLDELQADDYEYKAQILRGGYTGMYDTVFDWISEEEPEELTEETVNILNMYRRIDNSIPALSEEEQQSLDLNSIEFEGFDNHEKHYHVMRLMRSHGLWDELDNKPEDSHSGSSIIKYRRMLEVYNTFERDSMRMTFNQIEQLVNAVN